MNLKIKKVALNRRKKAIEIETKKGLLSLPFSRLPLVPTAADPIFSMEIDPELASMGISYSLKSGKEGTVLVDAFLDYNRDPDYLRIWMLHELTGKALKLLKGAGISKHEITRRLKTSPSQLARLLDPTNSSKSLDEMVRLITVLGYRLEWQIVKEAG